MSSPQIEPRAATPTYGWTLPVIADAADLPYWLTELAMDVEATTKGRVARLAWGTGGVLAAGTVRIATAPDGSGGFLTGGFTVNAGTAVVPVAGVYRISGHITFTGTTAGQVYQARVGSEAAVDAGGIGSLGMPMTGGAAAAVSVFSTVQSLPSGARVGLWYGSTAAGNLGNAELTVEWAGTL